MNNKKTSFRSVGMRNINALSVNISRIKTLRDDEGRRGFTLKRHAELSLLSISTAETTQGRDPEQKPFGMTLCKGFTLIELLIVVLIIGVLAAIAVPQYQKAVLKSRFSSLMPTTQAIRDGQEAYYLNNSKYADEIAKLDVKTTSTDDMSIDVGDEEETPELSYVIASRPNINNNLIMYQKHSEKFVDNVHCEALKDNAQAQWLCKNALHGEYIKGGVSEGYDTYVLSGTLGEKDYFPQDCEGNGEKMCDCGGPIVGYCDDKEGQWVYEESCPEPTLQDPIPCGEGFDGEKIHKAQCNADGTAYEYYWDESNCQKRTSCGPVPDFSQMPCECGHAGGGRCDASTNFEWIADCPRKWENYVPQTETCDPDKYSGGKKTRPLICDGNQYVPSPEWDYSECVLKEGVNEGDRTTDCTPWGDSSCSGAVFVSGGCQGWGGSVDCSGADFAGQGSFCLGESAKCTGATFSGKGSFCDSGADCSGSTFSGKGSFCDSGADCSGSTFSGADSFCGSNNGFNTNCSGATFKAGSKCRNASWADNNGCASATYDGGCCEGYGCPAQYVC